jgi:sugar-specific transcriptional regulator TrmB
MESKEASEDIEILSGLGLRFSEAKVFVALAELGPASAIEICNKSGVAREYVYQIMPKLIKKGIVEVTVTIPKKFKALPMEETYKILFRRKEDDNKKKYSKALETLKNRENKPKSKYISDFHITLVPSREAPDARIGEEYKKVTRTVDLTFPVGKFLQWSQYYAKNVLKSIIKRNVKMRIITQHHLAKLLETHPRIFTSSFKSKLKHINFRYIQEPFSVEMMIFDKKTLFVSTKKESDINKMVWLRTNNPLLLELTNDYFEAKWKNATEN